MRFLVGVCLALALQTPAFADIVSARYTMPTTRYDHAILGDAIEWGGLELTLATGKRVAMTLPQSRVFEDLEPRLADVDADGSPEVIVIETSIAQGARLAIYDQSGLVAATPYIGRTHRWLAPIGAADLDGDGRVEIAYIDRPHLAKTLRVWRFQSGALVHVTDQPGLTNHRIGEDTIAGGLRNCGAGPEMITADARWGRVIASVLKDGRIVSRDLGPHKSRASFATVLACKGL